MATVYLGIRNYKPFNKFNVGIVQEYSARVRACMHIQMYSRFECCGSETIHCIEFVIGSQPLLQECFSGSHSSKYVS